MKKHSSLNAVSGTNIPAMGFSFNAEPQKHNLMIFPRNAGIITTFAFLLLFSGLFFLSTAFSNQSPDYAFPTTVTNQENTTIPIILFDAGHNNIHNMNQSFYTFTKLLTADGYNIRAINGPFVEDPTLNHAPIYRKENAVVPLSDFQQQKKLANILVIASACSALPCDSDTSDAFTDAEVTEIRQWVEQGGSLFLIFDHTPYNNVTSLVSAFGINLAPIDETQLIFTTPGNNSIEIISSSAVKINGGFFSSGQLGELNETSDLVSGRIPSEFVAHVQTFTGQGFQISQAPPIDTAYEPLMTFSGISQGMALTVGEGKVYISGEAAMFSAQVAAFDHSSLMGFQNPFAEFNQQYLKNIIHWLDGRISAISGQVTLADGTGVSGVSITFTNSTGRQWSTVSRPDGYYISPRGVQQNNTYIVNAVSDVYDFSNNGQTILLRERTARDKDFSAIPK